MNESRGFSVGHGAKLPYIYVSDDTDCDSDDDYLDYQLDKNLASKLAEAVSLQRDRVNRADTDKVSEGIIKEKMVLQHIQGAEDKGELKLESDINIKNRVNCYVDSDDSIRMGLTGAPSNSTGDSHLDKKTISSQEVEKCETKTLKPSLPYYHGEKATIVKDSADPKAKSNIAPVTKQQRSTSRQAQALVENNQRVLSGNQNFNEEELDPMSTDYKRDIGLNTVDPAFSEEIFTFNEHRIEDVPCRFHDGFSGTCWKGKNCLYSHKLYTGGIFAKAHPDLAFAASITSKPVTSVVRLPHKPVLNNEREIVCRISHIVNPGEFYIRPTSMGAQCSCHHLDEVIRQVKTKDENVVDPMEQMEGYHFGFGSIEIPQGPVGNAPEIYIPKTMDEKLDAYLKNALNYTGLRVWSYKPHVELVAARVEKKWMRAVALKSPDSKTLVRVQLLDTGAKYNLPHIDVCQLPEQFCNEHAAAFRCALFGVSPVWCLWSKSAISKFTELVGNAEIHVIVKNGVHEKPKSFAVFERELYFVKVSIKEETGEWTDVAQILNEEGLVLPCNLMPYRPFASKVVSTEGLDFVHKPVPTPVPEDIRLLEEVRASAEWWDRPEFNPEREGSKIGGNNGNSSESNSCSSYKSCSSVYSWDSPDDAERLRQLRAVNNHRYLRVEQWAIECAKLTDSNIPPRRDYPHDVYGTRENSSEPDVSDERTSCSAVSDS